MTIYRSHLPDQPVPYMNAYSFAISNPNNTPDAYPILIDGITKQTITFGQWKRDIRRFATALQRNLGFKRGDVLALFSFNQIDYSVTMFGPILLAGITTTVNSAYNADELAYQLQDSGATLMITHPELLATARAGAQKVGLPEDRIFLYGDQTVDGFRPYTNLLPPVDTPESQLVEPVRLDAKECKETTALIVYSSGTTGRNKGVELSHLNFTVNAVQVVAFDGDLHAHDNVALSVLPMYHMYSIQLHLMCGPYSGLQNIVLQKFNPEDFLKTVQDYKIKTLNLVPPQVLMLVKSPLVAKYDLSHVRQLNVGAAPCSRELVEALLAKFPQIAFRQAYGMSEASPATHIGLYNDMVHGSAGKILPNQEVRLVDPDTGKDVANTPGERGEIWIRGLNVMKGYRNNPKATAETIDSEGWLHTGDVAMVDKNMNFFVVDRLKELIKYKGFQVAPAELEAILLTHPQILDAAVVGVENKEQATEVPLAFVVKNQSSPEGRSLTEQQVVDYVASKVAPHKKLRGGVRFIDLVPKSAAGKILRKDLRVLLQQPPKSKL
ncbi:hypothetical protein BGX23_008057 [Mortierella sp. AD031]|nr:hypothetical protein BGX23_008057 [Mortierella sp. AD031]KAG0205197.1 hypothetical protein BGX33_008034 [Mortierella sp. NVP41]